MCYDHEARSPVLPTVEGGTEVRGREVVLTARDGNRVSAFAATAAVRGGAAVVILPDVRGLHPFYEDLALRFAQAGVHAVAVDYFGRTAGLRIRDERFDHASHVERTTQEGIDADVAAGVAFVRSEEGGTATAVFTVGFCFGGRNSFNQAAKGHELAGVIGFYGRVVRRDSGEEETPVELVAEYDCAVLGLFGGADPAIPREDVEAFRGALDQAGVENELVVYGGAPHSFFDRRYEQYRDACEDAGTRMLRFIWKNSRDLSGTS